MGVLTMGVLTMDVLTTVGIYGNCEPSQAQMIEDVGDFLGRKM
jgi:hypothetical protein